ncbi:MAG: hypothetical protein IKP34_01275 [Bacteroidales bacterium]|nr:hypothetical protein [Bacteroidales bacterium]
MKREDIEALFDQFEKAVIIVDGVECRSARVLCGQLGYAQWRNFQSVIEKAKVACGNVGLSVSDHFADISKMVTIGSGAEREENRTLLVIR